MKTTLMLSQSDHMRAVGARLRRLAAALGLTLTELAQAMGYSKQTLNGWLNGEGYPHNHAVYKLCRTYGVTYDYLFLGDWSQLPAGLALKLEPGLGRSPGGAAGPDPAGGENCGLALVGVAPEKG
jgi:DNA-binding XRE family transcriptional regulator